MPTISEILRWVVQLWPGVLISGRASGMKPCFIADIRFKSAAKYTCIRAPAAGNGLSFVRTTLLIPLLFVVLVPALAWAATWFETPKKDHCVADGIREWSAIITGDYSANWVESCRTTQASISGQNYASRDCGWAWGRVWGKFDVPDATCNTRFWFETPKRDDCVGDGIRQWSAIITGENNYSGDWVAACNATTATIDNAARTSRNCGWAADGRVWGQFDVPDATCEKTNLTERRISLSSSSDGRMYVRLLSRTPSVATIDDMTELDVTDAHFDKLPSLVPNLGSPNCVSFESARYPEHFLRYGKHGDQIKLHTGAIWDMSFREDATFCFDGHQYVPLNKDGYYLGRSGSELVLAPYPVTGADPIIERAPVVLGYYCGIFQAGDSPPPGAEDPEDDIDISNYRGACTGTAPIETPKFSCATLAICDPFSVTGWKIKRLVNSCAVSTPSIGSSPEIEVTELISGGVIKIQRVIKPCS